MTLRRHLLLLLLAIAPAVWLLTLLLATVISRKEIDELYDTRQVRLAQQVLALLPADLARFSADAVELPGIGRNGNQGQADTDEMAISVSSGDGRHLVADRLGARLPRDLAAGFVDVDIDGTGWRVYTVATIDGRWRVVVGQMREERDELLWDLLAAQALPLVLALPLLLLAMAWAVRRALRPLDQLRADLRSRSAADLRPLDTARAPGELQPLLASMNALLLRVEQALSHERRLTADAAHELRTPLAALRAQWEAARAAAEPAQREQAQQRVGDGIERLSHLVSQLLALARAEGENEQQVAAGGPVDWPQVVRDALSDCLPLMTESGSEVEVEWPADGRPLPLTGSAPLLATLLRNLIDNALRYSPPGGTVRLLFSRDALVVQDGGPGLSPESLQRFGDRFFRPAGQRAAGSGLGLSIVKRIAALHGLEVRARNESAPSGAAATGLRVELRPLPA